jgi:O-methyltransferase involved in polyketide biosynthesis
MVQWDGYNISEQEIVEKAQRLHQRIGEHLTFGIAKGTIEQFLSSRGFCQIKNASPEFLERTYFRGADQKRKVLPYLPIVHATVRPRT